MRALPVIIMSFVALVVLYGCGKSGNTEDAASATTPDTSAVKPPPAKQEKFCDVCDARIYYEVTGTGSPIVMLHGGLYGSIEEFGKVIPKLSVNHKVIAVATRGHGKSELGSKPFSYRRFAEDAVAVLKNEGESKAGVVGFSDGAITAYVMAAEFPGYVDRVVALSGALSYSAYTDEGRKFVEGLNPADFGRDNADFVKQRKAMMTQPERWEEFLLSMKKTWEQPVYVTDEAAKRIQCPVVTVAGDRDFYIRGEHYFKIHSLLPKSYLAIVPNTGHVEVLDLDLVIDEFIVPAF